MIDPDDERTALSRRNDPAPAPEHDDAPDDRTLPSRRAQVQADAADATVISARWVVPSESEVPTQAATESAPAGPRRTAHPPAPEPVDASAAPRRAPSPSLAAEPAAQASPARGRVAARPTSASASYRARAVPPVTAVRAEPARRAPQHHVDTAAADAVRRRRRRRRTIAVVAAASILVIAAALALIALLTTG
ncbi:hypothetical protein [Microbacterium ureisolvens]|uniref:Uncharacterized protein n=1 Tax=Microbacterium ureisolvens TaxID=2781186 RepID=A0ABS7I3G2_9MICO|nr:hypothetical protein [Microbacterium ureisolvens]MBW9111028.1 hypothetical protein [Microbacterium ureisolvens]